MPKTILFALAALALAACGDPISSDDGDDVFETGAVFGVEQVRRLSADTDVASLRVSASFYAPRSSGFTPVAVERVENNGMPLPGAAAGGGVAYGFSSDTLDIVASIDRAPQVFAVWGANGVRSMRDSVDGPAEFEWRGPDPADTVDAHRDLAIRWEPGLLDDPEISVFAWFYRNGERVISRAWVSDDGAYVFPAEMLSRIDPGEFHVQLVRDRSRHGRMTDGRSSDMVASTSIVVDFLVR
jgi:hypothetical protein